MVQVITGSLVCFCIAAFAYRRKSLTQSGLYSALCMGILLSVFGGLFFLSILVAFFISSNIIGKFNKRMEKDLALIHEKSGARDYSQVLANGIPAFFCAVLFYFTGNHVFILGFATAIASSNADTWGSELGVLSKKPPVSILTWKPITTGLSGGITFAGSLASLAGALFIAGVFITGYYSVYQRIEHPIVSFVLCTMGGFTGSILDSLFGAAMQVKYYCEETGIITEKSIFNGRTNKIISGYPYVTNDLVNFISSFSASVLTVFVYVLFF